MHLSAQIAPTQCQAHSILCWETLKFSTKTLHIKSIPIVHKSTQPHSSTHSYKTIQFNVPLKNVESEAWKNAKKFNNNTTFLWNMDGLSLLMFEIILYLLGFLLPSASPLYFLKPKARGWALNFCATSRSSAPRVIWLPWLPIVGPTAE